MILFLHRVLLSTLAFFPLAAAPDPEPAPTPAAASPRLRYEEKSRGVEQGLEMVHYVLKTDGFPGDKRYALFGRWMDGRSTEVARGITIDESGGLVSADGDEVTLSLGKMFAGEVATFALVSQDGASKAFVEITPFPIEPEGKGGCRLFVRPMDSKGQSFSITGTGFKPDKKLETISTSANEVAYGSVKGRPDGSVKMVIFPAVVGRTGGEASFEASDSACSVAVHYQWGDLMRTVPPARQPTP